MAIVLEIEIDPSKTEPGKAKVESNLSDLERKGKETGKALSDALSELEGEQKAAEAIDKLNRQLTTQAAILARVRGPIDQYNRMLEAADTLLDQGRISTAEYTHVVQQLNAALASTQPRLQEFAANGQRLIDTQKAMANVSLPKTPEMPKSGMSQFLGGAGGQIAGALPFAGAAGAGAFAISAIGDAIDKFHEKRTKIDDATNSIVKFYDSFEAAEDQIPKFQELAAILNRDLGSVTANFGAVKDASDKLYLTQQQQIDLTRQLSMSMINNGRDIGEVAGIMQNLEFWVSKNTVDAGSFGRVLKQNSDIAAAWRKEFGMTNDELIKAAENGDLVKLGLDRLTSSILNTSDVTDAYNKRKVTSTELAKTGAQGWFEESVALTKHTLAVEDAKEAGIDFDEMMKRLELSIQKGSDKVTASMNTWRAFKGIIEGTTSAITNAGTVLGNFVDDPWSTAFEDRIAKIKDGMDKWRESVKRAAEEAKRAREAARAFNEELTESAKNDPMRIGTDVVTGQRSVFGNRHGGLGGPVAPSPDLDLDVGRATEINKLQNGAKAAEHYRRNLRATEDAYKQWAGTATDSVSRINAAFNDLALNSLSAVGDAIKSIGEEIVEAAFEADHSWSEFFKNLAKNSAKTFLSDLLNFGGKSMLAEIAPSMYGGAHAYGGTFIVPGSGPPDSQRVVFDLTPGERVDFTPPGQAYRPSNPQSGAPSQARAQASAGVTVVNELHPSTIRAAMAPVMGRMIRNEMVTNMRGMQTLLGIR